LPTVPQQINLRLPLLTLPSQGNGDPVSRLRFTSFVLLPLLLFAGSGSAHEVDQYDIPAEGEFVDLGDYWDQMLFEAVGSAVEKTNKNIAWNEKYNHIPLVRQARLAQLRSPTWLTMSVRRRLPSALAAILGLEIKLHLSDTPSEDPNQIQAYFASPLSGTYSHVPLVPDLRQIGRMTFMRSSTVKVHGNYIGTDKFAHFVAMGYWYYTYYLGARYSGKDQEEAIAIARDIGKHGLVSEKWFVGGVPTGVYSNADMVANYVGLKYYINVTEPVRLRGIKMPPMVVWQDDRWHIQPHVRPESDYFALFITPHLDEVLNPCLYEWSMRSKIRNEVRNRRQRIVDWYAGDNLSKRNPEHFDRILRECLTYYGEDYGHSGHVDKLITVANTCFNQRNTVAGGTTTRLVVQPPSTARISLAPGGKGSSTQPQVVPIRR
jgi:hypothetical protein